jgi:hypothetical protein
MTQKSPTVPKTLGVPVFAKATLSPVPDMATGLESGIG